MENEKLELIVLAGLLHDIGKLFERGEIFGDKRQDPFYTDVCGHGKDGRLSHFHAVHTLAFCEWLEERFGCLQKTRAGDWKRWCAAHHRDDETSAENSIIRISDRLSSSEREEGDYYRTRIHQKTFLEPVLERVFLDGYDVKNFTTHRYPLVSLGSDKDHLFAKYGDELGLQQSANPGDAVSAPEEWTHLVSERLLKTEYEALCSGLMSEIDSLSRQCPELSLNDLIVTLMTLLERYTANVPSATNLRHPDISLFDHLRTTAAIAQAMYLFQVNEYRESHKRFPVVLPEKDDTTRWILACGDFSGIQKFIYNLTNKGAAKGLRGRSFYVGQFCRLCADYLLKELGLTKAGLLYNSGGKFYLLIPAHLREKLYLIRDDINKWLIREFNSNVFLGLGLASVTAPMFIQGGMHEAWKSAADDLELDRSQKFKRLLDIPGFFDPELNYDPTTSCSVCGSRRIRRGEKKCSTCADLEKWGAALRYAGALLTVWGNVKNDDGAGMLHDLSTQRLRFDGIDATCHIISESAVEQGLLARLSGFTGELAVLNRFADCPFNRLDLPNCAVTNMYVGKWDPNRQLKKDAAYENEPWDFEDYAKHANGIKRLGILRMDVDNLGMVFIKGLYFPKRENKGWGAVIKRNNAVRRKKMASISRMVTLSRQLNLFFSGYVPRLLERENFNQCQTIYAGGDDLFIIGSWDQLPGLAETIRNEFKTFCCGNPVFSISGGLTLQRHKYPIYKGAQLAGLAEKKAKELRQQWDMSKGTAANRKDSFCFMDVPVLWEDFTHVNKIKSLLEADMDKDRGLLSYLSQVAASNTSLAQSLVRKKGLSEPAAWEEIRYAAWYWRTAYHLRRRYKDPDMRRRWVDILYADKIDEKKAALPVYTWLALPLRWTDFLHR